MNTIRNTLCKLALLCIGCICFLPEINAAQSSELLKKEEVTLDINNATLKNVFDLIERQTNLLFIYSNYEVDNQRLVSIKAESEPVQTILHKILEGTDLIYSVNDKYIILNKEKASVSQQNSHEIKGTILNESGESIIGANVSIKGNSSIGTITDIDGKFSLLVPDNAVLIISYIGYISTEIKVGNQRTLSIVLRENTQNLDEVVVVGYGVQQKRDITGSIANIKGDNLKDLPVANLSNALQGKAAGVDIVSDGGSPGAEPVIRVRGTGSMSASNPLVVIDGVPSGKISDVNPNDIETIEVLKDASSSAIYGTRAANGVVIITTKRGKKNVKTNIDVNAFYGISNISKTLDVLTAPELVMLKKERYLNDGIAVNSFWNNPYYETQRTDWQDELFNQGKVANVDLRMSGGNDKSNYMSSIGYYKEDGIIINSEFERVSLRLNSDHQINSRLRIGQSLQYTYRRWYNPSTQSVYSGVVWQALRFNPAIPCLNEDGTWGSAVENNELGDINNPVYELETERHQRNNHGLLTSITLDYKIIEDLYLKGNAAFDGSIYSTKTFYPMVSEQMRKRNDAELTQEHQERYSFLGEAYLAYKKDINNMHSINATAGFSAQKSKGQYYSATMKTFADEDDNQLVFDNGSTMGSINGNYYTETALASYFGRVFYSYNNRYLLTATFRADGSSKFPEGKRWGYFPAVSLGWRLSEENFMKNISWIDNLKVVGGWGLLGNQEVADLQYLTVMKKNIDYGNKYTFGTDKVGGARITSLANTNITWEKTGMTNIGIDGAFFDQKLTASITWFDKKTVDMLVPTVVVGTIGRATIPDSNIGEMRNRGWEIELGYRQNLSSGFNYNINFNASFVKNKILKLYGDNNYIGSITYGRQEQEISRSYEGKPIASFYGWKTDGLYQNAAEIQNDPNIKNDPRKSSISPGDVRFIDINNDGIIDEKDRTYIGDPNPNVILGLQTQFGYKGFDLSMNFIGSFGADLYNADRMQGLDPSFSYNMYSETLNRWHGEGTSNSIPRMTTLRTNQNHRTSDLFIESGDFVKLKNITLGYTIPNNLLKKISINNLRLFVSAENLFTITSYSGYSPEIGYTDGNKQKGVDYAQYPQSRKFTFGLNLNF
ncbi:TonB-dependent receptor [Parabacteroides bouchesdurhonensis]|uniref:TonB-dependent receptor n=1 Tax=Parabacteroides bouchesdurhonensis TaxID=1936995 RepID=UPI000C85D4BA|nr:TonB-dependent receptor [Parabacteroides bouchesdurhonensis]